MAALLVLDLAPWRAASRAPWTGYGTPPTAPPFVKPPVPGLWTNLSDGGPGKLDGRAQAALPAVPANRVLGLPLGSANVPGALRDLAASPANPDEISVATDQGIFRSADAGKSWTSLNDGLPNLPVVRLLNLPEGDQGVRIELKGNLAAEWPPGEKQVWLPSDSVDVVTEARLRKALGSLGGVTVTAVAVSGNMIYTGTADGQLRVSSDRGQTWQAYTATGSGKVERIWVNPADPRVALAVFGATPAGATVLDQRAHILHTINGGAVWDNLTANLPDVAAHGVTADRPRAARSTSRPTPAFSPATQTWVVWAARRTGRY